MRTIWIAASSTTAEMPLAALTSAFSMRWALAMTHRSVESAANKRCSTTRYAGQIVVANLGNAVTDRTIEVSQCLYHCMNMWCNLHFVKV